MFRATRAAVAPWAFLGIAAILFFPSPAAPADAPAPSVRTLNVSNKPWKGDFPEILKRRMLRVLVPYSRTLYYNDRGQERGLTAELARDFERWVNRKYRTGNRPLTVYLIPTTRDKLLSGLEDGLGEIAAGNLTITDARLRHADFVVMTDRNQVREVVVLGSRAAPLASVDDLAGRTVDVRPSSSYFESLVALNARFRASGKTPIDVQVVPDALEDEDLMEMANAGLVDALVVDDWKARLWGQILPKIRIMDKVVLRMEGRIGWAIPKETPGLKAALADFVANFARKQGVTAYRLQQSMARVKELQNPTATESWKRFEQTIALFRRYGTQYGFDPLMLAAQGYQESRLDPNVTSPAGAVGVMQLLPSTGKEMNVGDIRITPANIHAGAKYMDRLMRQYFAGSHFKEGNRPLFAFASYNAGAAKIARMRKEAARRGLDPDKWFNNVEVVVAEKIGIETTTYVRNIYKYYVSYRLALEAEEKRKAAIDQIRKQNS